MGESGKIQNGKFRKHVSIIIKGDSFSLTYTVPAIHSTHGIPESCLQRGQDRWPGSFQYYHQLVSRLNWFFFCSNRNGSPSTFLPRNLLRCPLDLGEIERADLDFDRVAQDLGDFGDFVSVGCYEGDCWEFGDGHGIVCISIEIEMGISAIGAGNWKRYIHNTILSSGLFIYIFVLARHAIMHGMTLFMLVCWVLLLPNPYQ